MGTPEEPQTLAAGELVWAKTKGCQHWWPARLPAACPAASKDAPVVVFGEDPTSAADGERRATRLRRFADPTADKMARASAAHGFLSAVELAHAAAVALLCTGLTCACASPVPAPPAAAEGVVSGLDNLTPSDFLASLRRAALDPPAVGLLDRVRLKSWARALAQGWGPAGAGRYTRRSVEELVDKIDLDDLNEPAVDAADEDPDKALEKPLKTPAPPRRRKGRPRKDASLLKEDTDAAEDGDQKDEIGDKIDLDDLNEPAVDAADEDPDKELEKPLKTPAPPRRRKGRPRKDDSSLLKEDTDAAENVDQKDEIGDQKGDESGGAETALSTGRKRKKSKYLSPPYTNLATVVLGEKMPVLSKEPLPRAAKDEKKVLRDNVDAREVLDLLHSFGEGFFQEGGFPKPAERFLGLFRSSKFAGVDVASLVSDSGAALKLGKSVLERSRKKEEGGSSIKRKKKMDKASPTATLDFPAENVVPEDGAEVAGLVSDSSAALKKGKGVTKRGRKKKDQDGSGGASTKRKKMEETSPTPTLPTENVSANTSAGATGLVPHSCATLEQGKGVMKRGRKKKDQDGSGGSSIKRKRMKKTSPTAILDSGLPITPAIPIRQMTAEDMLSQVRSGAGAGIGFGIPDQSKLVFKSPVSSAMSGGMKSGEEQDQGDGGSVVKTPVTVEATLPEADVNVESIVARLPAKSVQAEETKPVMGIQVDMNVQSGSVDVPVRSVQMETMELETTIPFHANEQGVVTDLSVRSGLLPKDGGISQPSDGNTSTANAEVRAVQGVVVDLPYITGFLPEPADGNTDTANVEVRTAQESYASLEAMVPEMYKRADEITTGINVNATGHAFTAEGQKGEQTSHAFTAEGQKGEQSSQKKTAGEAIANHAPAISTNGSCLDPPNSTPKRRNKKAPQHFANPAEILLEFTDGVFLPSKEELISTFSKFGILLESVSDILKDIRGARVVFGKSAEAEAVYTKGVTPGIFGQFGPPFATLKRLNYLPPFTLPSIPPPPPARKAPLGVADMRKNVENMMLSLAGKQAAATSSSAGAKPVPEYLLGEMQRLLLKLDNIQAGHSSSAGAPP